MAEMEDPEKMYDIVEELGKNTLAGVFKAKDKKTGAIVAVKVMDLGDEDEDSNVDAIVTEVTHLTVQPCPQLVRYISARRKGPSLWVILEYCEGGSALDAVKSVGLDERQIASVLQQTLLGLAHLHGSKTAHFAVKASNILLSRAGVKLTDFGEYEKLAHKMSKAETFVRSPFWMAPEVIEHGSEGTEGPASDIWALGITAIELATGEAPHASENPMKVGFLITNSAPPTLPAEGNYSAEFKSFVATCLNKAADKRPSAKDLLKHPFIAKAGEAAAVIKEVVERRERWCAEEEKTKRASGQQSTLQTVIYPSLARLLQACQSEEKALQTLVAIKQSFDTAEKAKPGISYAFVQQVIDVLRTNPK